MRSLYCPECQNYLEGGDGELHDCSCGWRQPRVLGEDGAAPCRSLYCPECGNYLEGGDGEMHDCSCGWTQPADQKSTGCRNPEEGTLGLLGT